MKTFLMIMMMAIGLIAGSPPPVQALGPCGSFPCAERGYRHGHGHGDHDTARNAVLNGEALPLSRILEEVEKTVPGRFIEASLKEKDGRLIYKVQWLDPEGVKIDLYYNARDGSRIHRRGAARRK